MTMDRSKNGRWSFLFIIFSRLKNKLYALLKYKKRSSAHVNIFEAIKHLKLRKNINIGAIAEIKKNIRLHRLLRNNCSVVAMPNGRVITVI